VGVTHSWVGDLIFKLTSPAGTAVTFFDRPDVPASAFGCSNNNLAQVILDDDGGFPSIETTCNAGGSDAAFPSGSFTPNNPLSAFDGQAAAGTWTLNVSDNGAGDTGQVRAFSLVFSCQDGVTPTPTPTPTPPPSVVTIEGRVFTPGGLGIRNAVVKLFDGGSNLLQTSTTSSFGVYSFTNVPVGQTYTLTTGNKRYRFTPKILTITTSLTNVDFIGLE